MQMDSKGSGSVQPATVETVSHVGGADADTIQSVMRTPSTRDRSDQVRISDKSLALASSEGRADAIDPIRGARIRERVLSGAYDTLEVVDAVARRLLGAGDL